MSQLSDKRVYENTYSININGKITVILFLSTQTDPRQEVELEASREPDSKIAQVEISSPLPRPNIESE
jgi:hypothetical protein